MCITMRITMRIIMHIIRVLLCVLLYVVDQYCVFIIICQRHAIVLYSLTIAFSDRVAANDGRTKIEKTQKFERRPPRHPRSL